MTQTAPSLSSSTPSPAFKCENQDFTPSASPDIPTPRPLPPRHTPTSLDRKFTSGSDYSQLAQIPASAAAALFRSPHDLTSAAAALGLTNGAGLFRPGFPTSAASAAAAAAAYTPPAHAYASLLQSTSLLAASGHLQNGKTCDDYFKWSLSYE